MFATRYAHIDKIFLADGNALTASTDFLVEVLDYIKIKFPNVKEYPVMLPILTFEKIFGRVTITFFQRINSTIYRSGKWR